jgi:hypothetical protein
MSKNNINTLLLVQESITRKRGGPGTAAKPARLSSQRSRRHPPTAGRYRHRRRPGQADRYGRHQARESGGGVLQRQTSEPGGLGRARLLHGGTVRCPGRARLLHGRTVCRAGRSDRKWEQLTLLLRLKCSFSR